MFPLGAAELFRQIAPQFHFDLRAWGEVGVTSLRRHRHVPAAPLVVDHRPLPQARSRLTTVYITTMFAGGALGSAAGAQAYEHWGWAGATLVAAAFPVLGLTFWLASRRHERAASGGRQGDSG